MREQKSRWFVLVVIFVPVSLLFLPACGAVNNQKPVPSISSISPATATAGSTGVALTVTGSNFVSGSVVLWNGLGLQTAYVNASQLTATVEDRHLISGADNVVSVLNPGSIGSNRVYFTVSNPAPVLTSMSPLWSPSGAAGIVLRVQGSGFSGKSSVSWNGTGLATTYVSTTELTASVPAANLASYGEANVTVVSPTPGGGTSTPLRFMIGASAPASNFVATINLAVKAMVWDASRSRIYATVPSTSSVVAIDPVSGNTSAPVVVGSQPRLIALSSDA